MAFCPKCGGQIQIKKTTKGRVYYGCENAPECDFMSWDKPSNQQCPKCGELLYEKRGKQKKLVCVKEGCGYVQEMTESEEER